MPWVPILPASGIPRVTPLSQNIANMPMLLIGPFIAECLLQCFHGKEKNMNPEIVKSLAHFLEAIPYQVATWDRHVVDHLAAHPEKMKDFHQGSATTKWRIYSSIKYQPQPR
jgi:hypothetical protein